MGVCGRPPLPGQIRGGRWGGRCPEAHELWFQKQKKKKKIDGLGDARGDGWGLDEAAHCVSPFGLRAARKGREREKLSKKAK